MQKLILLFLTMMISIHSFSQVQGFNGRFEVLNPANAGKIFRNPINEGNKPKGSPYLHPMFAAAKVENVTQKAFMRYNVFNDEFEFITSKNDTLILDKIDDFSNISFVATNTKYKCLSYTNSGGKYVKGYLIQLYEKADYVLYKKENITFYEEKIAKTSLETSTPPKYVKSDDAYYLKNKAGSTAEFPESKKQLIKLYPEKKAAIETFVKENKIDFDLEKDMIKIIDFLSA